MNGATCRLRPDFDVGYECLCLQNFRGSLCENTDTGEDGQLNNINFSMLARCTFGDMLYPSKLDLYCYTGSSELKLFQI